MRRTVTQGEGTACVKAQRPMKLCAFRKQEWLTLREKREKIEEAERRTRA